VLTSSPDNSATPGFTDNSGAADRTCNSSRLMKPNRLQSLLPQRIRPRTVRTTQA